MFGGRLSITTATARQQVRHATSKRTPPKADQRIPVQLLRDFANFGVRGEVVKVLPSVMRNYLHMNNGATYLTKTKGPVIPVVDRSAYLAQQEKIKQREAAQLALAKQQQSDLLAEQEAAGKRASAMSLDELSSLFRNVKGKRGLAAPATATAIEQEPALELQYTSLDVTVAIPATYNVFLSDNVPLPITKEYLLEQFYNNAGLEIPASLLALSNAEGAVSEAAAPGTYSLSIEVPNERSPVVRTLIVQ